jgi:hypothetical protein
MDAFEQDQLQEGVKTCRTSGQVGRPFAGLKPRQPLHEACGGAYISFRRIEDTNPPAHKRLPGPAKEGRTTYDT